MIDWRARVFFKAGRSEFDKGQWDLTFGVTYDRKRWSSFDHEIIPGCLTIRFVIWWVEITYQPSPLAPGVR